MDDISGLVCAFCGSTMMMCREMPASSDTHTLRFFTCETCGASELQIDRATGPGQRRRQRRA
jgi:hypothetical protein